MATPPGPRWARRRRWSGSVSTEHTTGEQIQEVMERIGDKKACEAVAADQEVQYVKMVGCKKSVGTGRVRSWKRSGTGSSQLPEELIISEILPRLPVKSLMRFKSVCKSWQAIISGGDPHFIKSHLQQSRQQLRAIVFPTDQRGSGVVFCHFLQESSSCSCHPELQHMPDIEALASTCIPCSHCDGLILFFSYAKLYVCNPATRELVILPTSSNLPNPFNPEAMIWPYNVATLGHDPLTNKYKVVQVFYRSSDLEARTCSMGVEVLTLGSSSLCWVPTQQNPPYPIWSIRNPATAGGIIYWLIDNTLHCSPHQAIMSFNLRDGKFGVIPPPPTWTHSLDDFQYEASLIELDGELCCAHFLGPKHHICIYRHRLWHVRYSLDINLVEELVWMALPLRTSCNGKILLRCYDTFMYYDPLTRNTEFITVEWPTNYKENLRHGGISYIESMLPIRQDNQG